MLEGGVTAVLDQLAVGLDLNVAEQQGLEGGAGLYEGYQLLVSGQLVAVLELRGR